MRVRSSLALSVERGGIRGALALFATVTAVAVAAAVAPSPAHAAFALPPCQEGSELTGEGSSLQRVAQEFWKKKIFPNPLNGGCNNAPPVNYITEGSGCGLDAVGAGVP